MTFDLKVLLLLRTVNKMLCWSPDRQWKCLFKTTNWFLSNVSKYSKVVKCSVFKFSSAALMLWAHVLPHPTTPTPPHPPKRSNQLFRRSWGRHSNTAERKHCSRKALFRCRPRPYQNKSLGHNFNRTRVWAKTLSEPESGPDPCQNQDLDQILHMPHTRRPPTCHWYTPHRKHYHDMKESHLYQHDATCVPYTQSHGHSWIRQRPWHNC